MVADIQYVGCRWEAPLSAMADIQYVGVKYDIKKLNHRKSNTGFKYCLFCNN